MYPGYTNGDETFAAMEREAASEQLNAVLLYRERKHTIDDRIHDAAVYVAKKLA